MATAQAFRCFPPTTKLMHCFEGEGIIFRLSTFRMGDICFQVKAILPGSLAIQREIMWAPKFPSGWAHAGSLLSCFDRGDELLTKQHAELCEEPSESTTDLDHESPLNALVLSEPLLSQNTTPKWLQRHTKKETDTWESQYFYVCLRRKDLNFICTVLHPKSIREKSSQKIIYWK